MKRNKILGLIENAQELRKMSMDDSIAEDEQDRYYSEYWQVLRHIAAKLVEETYGQIGYTTALNMAHKKTEEIKNLFERMES